MPHTPPSVRAGLLPWQVDFHAEHHVPPHVQAINVDGTANVIAAARAAGAALVYTSSLDVCIDRGARARGGLRFEDEASAPAPVELRDHATGAYGTRSAPPVVCDAHPMS